MTYLYGGEKPSLADMEHHGVKGMKWGVHRENRLLLNKRVAEGSGSGADKARVFLTQVSSRSVRKSGGLQSAAQAKVRELEDRKARIQKGKATILDYMALHGGDRIHEHSQKTHGGPVRLKINPTDTAVTRRVKNDYNTMSNRDFFVKYAASKPRYAKRVQKHGDPFKQVTTKHPSLVSKENRVQVRVNQRQERKDARRS